jgi:hypothetical protein
MWAVSQRYLDTKRTAHSVITQAVHVDPVSGVRTSLPVEDGAVTVDGSAGTRRSLSLTVPGVTYNSTGIVDLWQVLSAIGGEITVSKTTRFIDHTTEAVPLGVFVVDQAQVGYRPDGTLQLTCPDRWVRVQRNRFPSLNYPSTAGNAAWQEIRRLVEGAWPNGGFPGWSQLDTSASPKVGHVVWTDGDRAAAALDIAKAHSVEVFFDAQGKAVLRPVPLINTASKAVWQIDATDKGVMIDANRSRDMSRTRNAVIVSSSATDLVVAPQTAKNTTAGDPLRITGPLGFVPYYYDSPIVRTQAQALATAKTQLKTQLGVSQQITLDAAPNDALDAGDVISVYLPPLARNLPRPYELHIIDSVTIPLLPDGTQQIATRSTRPDTDGA